MKKVILITGSTDGIGKLAAIKLAKDGHHIYLHGRNKSKLDKVIAEVKNASSNGNIEGFVSDFSDLTAVSTMAKEITDQLSQIDVLINNAGVFKSSMPVLENGMDIRYVVNYLAPYLLSSQLMPLLKKSTEARIINLSSAAQASITENGILGKQSMSDNEAYAQSKLAILIWSFHLAQTDQKICTIALNPGSLLNTNMVREAYGKFWSSADKGADIIYDLAILDQHKDGSGKYFDNDRGAYGEAHADAYDDTKIQQLITLTEQLVSR